MDKVVKKAVSSRPGFWPWIARYGRTWHHQPYYDGREYNRGHGDVIRVLGPNITSNCCTFSEMFFTIADHFNWTLEYVVDDNSCKKGCESADVILSDAADYFTNKMADVVSLPSHMIKQELFDISLLAPTHYEVYEIAIVVPKSIGVNTFDNFLSALLPASWIAFLFFVGLVTLVGHLSNKAFNKKQSGFDVFFLYFQLTLGQGSKQRGFLVGLWLLLVSIVFIQVYQGKLLETLIDKPVTWPHSLSELAEQSDDYSIWTKSLHFFNKTGNRDLQNLVSKATPFTAQQLPAFFRKLTGWKTVFIGRSIDIDNNAKLLNPKRFAVLDERFLLSQYALVISKSFSRYRQVANVIHKMNQAGVYYFDLRMALTTILLMRMSNPKNLKAFLTVEEESNLNFVHVKGVFVILVVGFIISFLIHVWHYFCFKSREKQKERQKFIFSRRISSNPRAIKK